ncbi:Dynein light chain 1, axonemal [Dendrobium catenatum]|uniref:Dynein light chain 1, axonemal n=1 Tax=Dendrobium catenatum TaxID=906689 RepID=A0A2I0WW64_9ASPA|nr:Dynein light chain 1, axonemal [Dendrobium catenatum]
MTIVTGDRYLEYLVKFAEQNAGALLEGSLTLKLNPVGLHYVQSRLEALQELEGLIADAPVDYLRAYVSDLGDHRALEQLRRILGLLTSLKVISVHPQQARDPTPLSLQAFGCLRVLELRGCDISTSSARGLLELRHSLEKLICHNSTDALRHVFTNRIADIKDSPVWSRLTFVSCAHNSLVLMDESLQLLPSVETLDLSRNQFAKVDNLGKSSKLRHLDLGFNHLRTIASLSQVSCPIVKLVLRNNVLRTLRGLENLKLVEGLDLSCNLISSFSEMEILANLPCLQNLWLEGNPICYARWYRAHVFSFFSHPERLILDDNNISTKEYWERHIIYTSRQKQPPAYGFYFPAEIHTEEDSSAHANKKKYFRLANIEDNEQREHLCMEAIEQDSLSCDSDNLRKDEITTTDDESKIIGLMNKVEHLKKERSVLWLRDFKDWMNQSSDIIADRNQQKDLNLDFQSEQSREPLTDANFGEGSHCANSTTQKEGGGSFSNITYSDISDNGILDKNVRTPAENDEKCFVTGLRSQEVISEQAEMDDDFRNPDNLSPSPLIVNDKSSINYSTVCGSEHSDLAINSGSFTAIDEIIGSHSSSIYHGSPPHYREDILHRRLYLEEEFLQLSTESHSVELSDSDTSSSEDESCVFNMSMCENDCNCIQGFALESSNHGAIHANNHRNEQEEPYPTNVHLCEDQTKLFDASNEEASSTNNHADSAGCCTSSQLNQGARDIKRINCKQQLKIGFVSLFGNLLTGNSQSECEKVNGVLESHRFEQGQSSCCANGFSYGRMNDKVLQQKHGAETVLASIFDKNKQNEYIKDFFNSNIADSEASETCQQIVFCGFMYQQGSVSHESEAALLRSCKNKLYMLLLNKIDDGLDNVSKVPRCYELDEIREVVTGLGLQTLSENLIQFGSPTYCLGTPPYYSLDSLCPIQNILELIIESEEDCRCLTLIAGNVPYGNIFLDDSKRGNLQQENRRSCTWKLKWVSEDYLMRFVSLLKAMYLGFSATSLHVKYAS